MKLHKQDTTGWLFDQPRPELPAARIEQRPITIERTIPSQRSRPIVGWDEDLRGMVRRARRRHKAQPIMKHYRKHI